jgi:hypothetical protein|tara:strand:+ start:361 stop:756 length:396 start_codon:yes stop_codon:yes gene_type:complete
MQTYEINLWQDKKIIEKVVKQFKDDDEVLKYINDNFDTNKEPQYPSLDPTRGYVRPKAQQYIITWSKVNTYVRKKGPSRMVLTDKEKELQGTLEQSITKEAIDEWGHNEMMRQVRKYYWGQPHATGQEEKK